MRPGDFARARLRGFQARVAKALGVIEEAAKKGRIGISFSGGKDSLVVLDLVRRVVPDAPAAFFDSGCEYRWTYETVARFGAKVIKPQMSLLEMCRYGGYWGYATPVDAAAEFDFFAFLVSEPSARFVAEEGLSVIALGLRGQESSGRRASANARGELYYVQSEGVWHLCPLAHWTFDDVWAYIADRGLDYNEVYDRMAQAGIPRENWRVSTLLGMTGAATMGRYSFLRRVDPEAFYRLAAEFPKILEFT